MERKVQILQEIDRVELFGNLDANLDLIKEATGVDIFQRDDGLTMIAAGSMTEEEQKKALDDAQAIIDEFVDILTSGESLGKQKASYVIGLKKEGLSYKRYSIRHRTGRHRKDVYSGRHGGQCFQK